MKIGIIGALKAEMDRILAVTRITDQIETRVSTLVSGTLAGQNVALSRCGIGKINAAMCAQSMILEAKPDIIINIGVAGALQEGLGIADAVIGEYAVIHDFDTTGFGDPPGLVPGLNTVRMACDPDAVRRFARAARELDMHYVISGIATGDQFIAGRERKSALHDAFACAACDMEGGAVAQVCAVNGVPYAAYRTVSDTLQGSEEEFSVNLERSADASARLLMRFLAMLP